MYRRHHTAGSETEAGPLWPEGALRASRVRDVIQGAARTSARYRSRVTNRVI